MLEPISPADPMLVRLVGGPFDGQIAPVPEGAQEWVITQPAHWARGGVFLVTRVPERRHRYCFAPYWRVLMGKPLPFVYAGVVDGNEAL